MKKHIKLEDVREDILGKCLTQDEVLKGAEYTEKGHVKVYGKFLGEGGEA